MSKFVLLCLSSDDFMILEFNLQSFILKPKVKSLSIWKKTGLWNFWLCCESQIYIHKCINFGSVV